MRANTQVKRFIKFLESNQVADANKIKSAYQLFRNGTGEIPKPIMAKLNFYISERGAAVITLTDGKYRVMSVEKLMAVRNNLVNARVALEKKRA